RRMTAPEDGRPRPEQFLSLIRQQQRGRLKIYLGFAPGVGKTYEMLQEGQRLKRQGVDVVIGVVETHGRADTAALVGELEQVLSQADQIINVDVSAEDLQERLKSGKVYPAERVERALSNFFTESNLMRLRELALEEMAQALDRRRQDREGGEKVVSERVMVCLSSRSPNVHYLLRRAARLAGRFNAPWYAVYIRTPQERLEKIDAATQRAISDSLTLAQQ